MWNRKWERFTMGFGGWDGMWDKMWDRKWERFTMRFGEGSAVMLPQNIVPRGLPAGSYYRTRFARTYARQSHAV